MSFQKNVRHNLHQHRNSLLVLFFQTIMGCGILENFMKTFSALQRATCFCKRLSMYRTISRELAGRDGDSPLHPACSKIHMPQTGQGNDQLVIHN